MSRVTVALTTTLMITILAGSGAAQRETPPPGGEPKDLVLPPARSVTLDNGLTATLVEFGTLPKVTVRVVLRVGNLNEDADRVWIADLTADLLKEGTESMDARTIARRAAGMGGSIEVSVDPDLSSFEGEVLSEFGPDLVTLLSDIVMNPSFPEEEFERLRKDAIRELSIDRTRPQNLAREKFRAVLYDGHPYGRVFPTEEMLRSYTLDDVRLFYGDNYGAQRTHVYVVGRFDGQDVEGAIREAFKDWRRGPEPTINPPSPSSERMIYLIDRPGAPQSTLYIGLPVPDPSDENYIPVLVTNTLLGGYFSSRITTNIREDKGYTYSPFSAVSTRYHDAYWVEVADVTTDVTGPALEQIFHEIDRLHEEPVPEEELEGVENYMTGTFIRQNSSRNGIVGQLSFMDLHGLGKEFLDHYIDNIQAVTPGQVGDVARNVLDDRRMTIVIVGDVERIAGAVAPFGPIAR
jgi:zinc protease